MLPRFTNGVEVAVNGVVILDSRRNPAANRPDRNTPEIAVIPASLLRDGANDLAIRLFVWGPITGFLDRLYVGPDDVLRPSYDTRTLLFVTLPVVFSAWQAILAVILGIMWAMRRHEPAYGVLAAAMAIGVAQAFFQTPLEDSAYSRLNAMLISAAPLESAFVLTFALLFFGWKWPRYGWLIFAPGLVVAAAGLIGDATLSREAFLLVGAPTVGLYVDRAGAGGRPLGVAATGCRQFHAGLRADDRADLLGARPALGASAHAQPPHPAGAAVLFGDAGGDRRRR